MKLKTIGSRMFGWAHRPRRGQSLVEMALIAPLLILMFIGVFEVGWALRGYMIILNASREAARFAARGRYIDYSGSTSQIQAGYQVVISHTLDALGYVPPYDTAVYQGQGSVAMKLVTAPGGDTTKSGYGTIIISHFLIDTQKPCNPPNDCNGNGIAVTNTVEGPEIDCAKFKNNPPDSGWVDPASPGPPEKILGPSTNPITQTFVFPSPPNHSSRVIANAAAKTIQYKADNNYFNCVLHAKDPAAPYSANSIVIVEIYFNQPQLLGVPLVSNPLTDPIPLYAYTEMRITGDVRGTGR